MNILLTGGTGFIGSSLCKKLLARGDQITVLTRRPEQLRLPIKAVDSFNTLSGDEVFDVIINLAGEPIADRPWTQRRRRVLRDSRIALTQQLFNYIEGCKQRPSLLINASAIGFYGDQGDDIVVEGTEAKDDFAHQLCRDWEHQAQAFEALGIGVCILRIGLVLGRDGGFLSRLMLPFRCGLGGPLGDGQQWMSWVHRDDVVGIIEFILDNNIVRGVFNATAPNPVSNDDFTRQLARRLHRPAFFRVPALLLKRGLGELSSLLLGSQRVQPVAIVSAGYCFKYARLDDALNEILTD